MARYHGCVIGPGDKAARLVEVYQPLLTSLEVPELERLSTSTLVLRQWRAYPLRMVMVFPEALDISLKDFYLSLVSIAPEWSRHLRLYLVRDEKAPLSSELKGEVASVSGRVVSISSIPPVKVDDRDICEWPFFSPRGGPSVVEPPFSASPASEGSAGEAATTTTRLSGPAPAASPEDFWDSFMFQSGVPWGQTRSAAESAAPSEVSEEAAVPEALPPEGSAGVTEPTFDGEGAGAPTTMDEEEAEAGVEVGGEAETGVERTVEESEEEEPPGIVLSAPWTELTEEGEEIFRDPLRRVFLPPRLLPASAACPAPGEAPASEGGGGGPSEAEVPRSSPGVAEGGVAAMAAPLRPPVGGEEVVSLWKPKEAAGGDAPPSSAVEEEEEEEEPRFERRLSGLRNKLRFLTSARKMGFSEQLRVVDLPALSELPKTPYRPQVVSVFSGKGGVGKSTIAINLAAYLSHVAPNLNVCEVDLDIEHGDTYLIALREEGQDLERRRIPTIYDLVRGIEIGAVTKGEDARPFFVLDGYSGCSFLAAPHFPSQGARIGEREMEAVFRLIKDMGFHVIVLDCGVNLRDEVTQFAIMFSQQVVFVTEASTSSINRVMKGISEILGTPEFGLHPNRIKLVFNKLRKDEDVGIDPKAVRREEFPFVRDVFYLGYDVRVARAWNYGFLGIYTPSKGFKLGIKRIAESVVRDFED